MAQEVYKKIIKSLPKADISLEGVEAYLAQGDTFQIVFFEIQPGAAVPPHKHKAQFGIVLEGHFTLTIGKETREVRKGDIYYIPEGTIHSGEFSTFCRVMDYFAEPKRYRIKQ